MKTVAMYRVYACSNTSKKSGPSTNEPCFCAVRVHRDVCVLFFKFVQLFDNVPEASYLLEDRFVWKFSLEIANKSNVVVCFNSINKRTFAASY